MKAQSCRAQSIADRHTFTAAVSPSREAIRTDHNGLNAGVHADRSDLVPLSLKSYLLGFRLRAGFDLRRAVPAAEVRQVA